MSRGATDFLKDAARRAPEAPALREGDARWSWRELDREADLLATGLRTMGAPGRVVATLLPNAASGVLAVLSVPRSGAVLAPLNPRLTPAEVAAALDVLEPALLLCDAHTEAQARAAAGAEREARVVRVETLAEGRAPVGGGRGGRGAPAPPGAWGVVWTSGTSGRPRGVLLSAAALAASAEASRRRLGLGRGDRWYASLGLAHVGGLALVTRAAALGASLVTTPRFDAEAFDRLVDAGEVTHASLVPAMLRQVLELREGRPFPGTFRCALLGGAHTPRPLLDRALAAGVPVALTYGMTETTSQAATAAPELVRRKPGTVGTALDGVRLLVAEDGEILVRGDTLALGYLGDDAPIPGEDGWLHTGDLGERDDDGDLWVTGRRAERIVTGGVNVDPAEVEDVLRLHDGVADAAVTGVPDADWGEVVAAAVVRRAGAWPDPGELEALARERLTTAKIPRRWAFVEAIPRNPNGKVARDSVRTLLEDGATPTG